MKIILPSARPERRDIYYLRDRVLFGIIMYLVPVGLLALVPRIFISFQTGVSVVGYGRFFGAFSDYILYKNLKVPA